MHFYIGIVEGMSVLTTTIDRAFNQWGCRGGSLSFSTYSNICIINPCHIVIAESFLGDITAWRTEYHAVVMAVDTNRTASDGYIGHTSASSMKCFYTINLDGTSVLRIIIRCIFKVSHSSVCTAAINVVIDGRRTADGNIGIAKNQSATHNDITTTTTAIDITHCGAAKVCSTIFGFTDSTATDVHIGVGSISCWS